MTHGRTIRRMMADISLKTDGQEKINIFKELKGWEKCLPRILYITKIYFNNKGK